MTKRSNQGIANVKKEKKNIPAYVEFLMKELFSMNYDRQEQFQESQVEIGGLVPPKWE